MQKSLVFILLIIVIVIIALVWRHHVAHAAIAIVGAADKQKDLKANPRSRSEARIIKMFEELTGEAFPSVYPEWLVWRGHKMELDGYCDKLRLAVEYQGPLHTKWASSKESYATYFDRIMRDRAKRALCKRNRVRLIVIDASVPMHQELNYVKSRLADAGLIERPFNYMEEKTVEPYRNMSIEIEEGLN